MGDNTRLGRALAEEERNNPEVAAAARKYDETREKILDAGKSRPASKYPTGFGASLQYALREVDERLDDWEDMETDVARARCLAAILVLRSAISDFEVACIEEEAT
jgi:hypothetical protein